MSKHPIVLCGLKKKTIEWSDFMRLIGILEMQLAVLQTALHEQHIEIFSSGRRRQGSGFQEVEAKENGEMLLPKRSLRKVRERERR